MCCLISQSLSLNNSPIGSIVHKLEGGMKKDVEKRIFVHTIIINSHSDNLKKLIYRFFRES